MSQIVLPFAGGGSDIPRCQRMPETLYNATGIIAFLVHCKDLELNSQHSSTAEWVWSELTRLFKKKKK